MSRGLFQFTTSEGASQRASRQVSGSSSRDWFDVIEAAAGNEATPEAARLSKSGATQSAPLRRRAASFGPQQYGARDVFLVMLESMRAGTFGP